MAFECHSDEQILDSPFDPFLKENWQDHGISYGVEEVEVLNNRKEENEENTENTNAK